MVIQSARRILRTLAPSRSPRRVDRARPRAGHHRRRRHLPRADLFQLGRGLRKSRRRRASTIRRSARAQASRRSSTAPSISAPRTRPSRAEAPARRNSSSSSPPSSAPSSSIVNIPGVDGTKVKLTGEVARRDLCRPRPPLERPEDHRDQPRPQAAADPDLARLSRRLVRHDQHLHEIPLVRLPHLQGAHRRRQLRRLAHRPRRAGQCGRRRRREEHQGRHRLCRIRLRRRKRHAGADARQRLGQVRDAHPSPASSQPPNRPTGPTPRTWPPPCSTCPATIHGPSSRPPTSSCRATRRTPPRTQRVLKFFDWSFRNGAATADRLHYIMLPAAVQDRVARSNGPRSPPAGKPLWRPAN